MESKKKVFVKYGTGSWDHETKTRIRNYDYYLPVCATAKKIDALVRTELWTLSTIQRIGDLGFEVIALKDWDGLDELHKQEYIYKDWLIRKVEKSFDYDQWIIYALSPELKKESHKLDDYFVVNTSRNLPDAIALIDRNVKLLNRDDNYRKTLQKRYERLKRESQ
tara:strand:+ start:48 stop:542 length:495 start_codon:yes stop_codon:yes gene_type:complete